MAGSLGGTEAASQSTYTLRLPASLRLLLCLFLHCFYSRGRPEMRTEIEGPSLYLQNLEHDLVDGKAFFCSGPVPGRHLQRQMAAVTFSSPTAVRCCLFSTTMARRLAFNVQRFREKKNKNPAAPPVNTA